VPSFATVTNPLSPAIRAKHESLKSGIAQTRITTMTAATHDRTLRPATAKPQAPAPKPGSFTPANDPRLSEMQTGGALGTSMLVLYPVFACVIVVLTGLSMAAPTMPV
jgi:hypothetical protein